MRILLIHSDYLEYEITSKTKIAEEIEDSLKKGRMEDCLSVFVAVEIGDDDSVIDKTFNEIEEVSKSVKTEKIFLYPYAHLSNNLAPPELAVKLLKDLEIKLKSKYEIKRAPFGYYKAFKVSCKGHPLSELSRSITSQGGGEVVSEALKAEERIKSSWYILDPSLNLIPQDKFDFKNHDSLKKLTEYEVTHSRKVDMVPPHVEYMKNLELVDYEKGSDPGNLRWYPKGVLIKRLLETQVTDSILDYGGMEVETPIMYSITHPMLSKYLNRFPARQYIVKSGADDYFLRFAACFGQYLMKHDMIISYKDLPLRLYELTRYSFRREQRGELVGLRRLRAFTMPDMHTLAPSMGDATNEFIEQFKLSMKWMDGLGLNYEVAIRFVKSFYDENRDFVERLMSLINRPVLVEMWNERPFYFVMKFEFNFVDSLNKASALSTVQIDIENTERFEIKYFDEEGKEKYPLMLHASISGAIERNLYALLETAYIESKKGKKPMLPLWLSPTQARVLPVGEEQLDYSLKILEELERSGIRVDIDDRDLRLGKKIRDAEKDWVPYIIVIGEDEIKNSTLNIRSREDSSQKNTTVEEFKNNILEIVKGKPTRPLPLPRKLSLRASFR
ncbi:MAG: Threonine--tRNA ligase [Candidatus Methanofastidiosum methylothiophilum]|uniref:Threonine--tRNA ligase n=1 Tax=Candidatus Methanofastidiosum methylothiophilum TaxID=1705564 RepID=A0A150IX70_9EURY|nr:MAG: Threonine--tRNA ligase [Candidatus Methanofastidiosum methylthiophilus]